MKKLFTGLLTLLCVFGVQTIPMNAKENSNDNSTQNTNNNKAIISIENRKYSDPGRRLYP
mgnify:CR=1 FL=1